MVTTITVKPGTPEVIELKDVQIPDLWHIATLFSDANAVYEKQQDVKSGFKYPSDYPELDNVTITIKGVKANMIAKDILDTWHLCHDLLRNLRDPKLTG